MNLLSCNLHQVERIGSRLVTPRTRRNGALFNERIAERVADTMFALSTPSRVQILGCLLDGPRAVSELTEALAMEQSAVSHQLRILRDHALVKAERVGRQREYALYDEHVVALLEEALRHVEQRSKGRLGLRGRRAEASE
jgi:DNA-binding transcriptional ArsR family regulator